LEVLFLLFYPFDYCCLLLVILPKDCGPFFFLMLSLAFFAKAHYELVMNQEGKIEQLVCISTMLIPIKLVG
jgi:hypothetical protein